MQTPPIVAIILSLLMLLGLRGLFGAYLAGFQSRKAQKVYRADVPFWDRWFFISTLAYVQDRYDKLERKVVKARATVRAMRVMNFILHVLLVPVVAVILLHVSGVLDGVWGDRALTAYVGTGAVCALLVTIIDEFNHRMFWRTKRRM